MSTKKEWSGNKTGGVEKHTIGKEQGKKIC